MIQQQKTLKNLGSTFASVGKALLTNPLFLLAAAITIIVVAVVKLMDEMGVLQLVMDAVGKVFEWLMIPIDALIQGLKDLTDWFGWTDNAGDDLAKNTIKNNEKLILSNKEKNEKYITAMDHEINMAKAAGKETSKLELKKAGGDKRDAPRRSSSSNRERKRYFKIKRRGL